MACFSVGFLLIPPLMTARLYKSCGRRGAAQLGLVVLSLGLLFYSVAYFIPDSFQFLFAFASALARVLEGLGSGGSVTAFISLISQTYPRETVLALSARSAGASLGMCLGAVIGSSLYSLLGYFAIYFVFSGVRRTVMALLGFFCSLLSLLP